MHNKWISIKDPVRSNACWNPGSCNSQPSALPLLSFELRFLQSKRQIRKCIPFELNCCFGIVISFHLCCHVLSPWNRRNQTVHPISMDHIQLANPALFVSYPEIFKSINEFVWQGWLRCTRLHRMNRWVNHSASVPLRQALVELTTHVMVIET